MKAAARRLIRTVLPLSVRKSLAVWLGRQGWINEHRRHWWSTELVRDLSARDINLYHKFLWSNHLSYASTYEIKQRFGREKMKGSRKVFFEELKSATESAGLDPATEVRSVFEVGCSLGYQLRYMETELFTGAGVLDGVDIDEYAIRTGNRYLTEAGSKVRLVQGDMERIDEIMGDKPFDVVVCTGVLMYLNEEKASSVLRKMLQCTGALLALSGLANPETDNSAMNGSATRANDQSFIHNFDRMVIDAGGNILSRRWEGNTLIDGNSIYFVFASPEKEGR